MNRSSTRLYLRSTVIGTYGLDRLACIFASLISVMVLIGWALDIEPLKRPLPTLVAMNPLTAVAFIFLSVSVWASHSEDASPVVINAARFSAFVALLIGGLKLCELTTGWFAGVDQILFREKLSGDPSFLQNSIAPNTALNFVLLSLAVMFPRKRNSARIEYSTVLILVSILGSFLPMLGYLYGTKPFYGVGQYIPMAPHTALAFLLLGIGLLFAPPERNVITPLLDKGMSGVMTRRLMPAVIILPIAIGWFRLKGQQFGLYDNELGAALVVIVQILVLSLIVWWSSFLLIRLDRQRQKAEASLAELVLTDDLTGLRNRRGFVFLAEQELKLARNKRMGIILWCLYADLDGLKKVNDTLGHDTGDEAIVHTADILKATFRDSDIIARLGGDEFAILAATNTRVGGEHLIERIQSNVNAFNAGSDLPYELSLSVGLVAIDSDERLSLDEIVAAADAAMYSNKQAKKDAAPDPAFRLLASLA